MRVPILYRYFTLSKRNFLTNFYARGAKLRPQQQSKLPLRGPNLALRYATQTTYSKNQPLRGPWPVHLVDNINRYAANLA